MALWDTIKKDEWPSDRSKFYIEELIDLAQTTKDIAARKGMSVNSMEAIEIIKVASMRQQLDEIALVAEGVHE